MTKITSRTCRFETCTYLKLPNFKLKFISWERVTFRLRKSECSESLESERFTMSVAWVVNCGEKFDNCSWANKWEWISVNGSQIGRVGRRREKPLGRLKLCLFARAVFQQNKKLLCNPKQFDVLLAITNEIILHVIKKESIIAHTHTHTHTHTGQFSSVHVILPPFLCSFNIVVCHFKLKHMVQPDFSCPPLFSVSLMVYTLLPHLPAIMSLCRSMHSFSLQLSIPV